MEEVTYSEIADYFISFYYQKGDNITNFRLHKLLYYAQVKSLALYNKRLFNEDFFAWKHGPALPALHRDYNNGHWSPVSKEQSQHYIQAFEKKIKDHQLLLLKEVLARYDWLSEPELTQLYENDAAWNKAQKETSQKINDSWIIESAVYLQ